MSTFIYNFARCGGQDSSVNWYKRIESLSLTAGEMFFWYGPSISLSFQIANVASEHHGKNNGGPNQWIIRVMISPRLLKIHLFLLVESSQISTGDV